MEYKSVGDKLALVFVAAITMSIYAYLRLSTNSAVLPLTILVMTILEIVLLAVSYKTSSKLETAFEAAFFLVLLSVLLGAYKSSLSTQPVLLFATIFYRPGYMRHGNRRLAFMLSLLIMGTVLPVTCGLVTDSGSVQVLSLLYALLVLCLWVFCSKLGSSLIGHDFSE